MSVVTFSPKKWAEVIRHPLLVVGDIERAALAPRDHLELVEETLGSLLESLALLQLARAIFSDQAEIPVARHVLGARKAIFLRGGSTLPSCD